MTKPVFHKSVLANGIRVLTEKHSNTRCVVVGFWLDRGTRDESSGLIGVSHLIEHLVFKGTQKFSALDIAKKIEAIGGEINAFTSKEHTCFHATTLEEDLELSIDILSQLFCQATFAADEFEKEKNVVIQELLMSRDDIEDSVFDTYFLKAFPKNPLGWPILGTEKSLSKISQKKVVDWYTKNYLAGNLIVSVTGNIEHTRVVELVERYLGHLAKKSQVVERKAPKMKALQDFTFRDSEQVHVVMGLPTLPYGSPQRFNAFLVNALLGGGMTSRLYQNIREEKGWAYSIFSMLNTYTDFGVQLIYAATDKKLYQKLVEETLKTVAELYKVKVPQEDVDYYRRQVKGQLLIASEDIESRMTSLAVNEMTYGEYRSVESVIDEIEAVTREGMHEYIDDHLDLKNYHLYLVGDLKENKVKKWMETL